MFEQTFEEMTAVVTIESGIYQTLTASNVGVNTALISEGGASYSSEHALRVIRALDKALLSCPKYLIKRIRAQRNSFVFAFGPDMEERI